MKEDLYAMISSEVPYSLAQLARAIACAPRRDALFVRRVFLRTHGNQFVREQRTQRIRIRYSAPPA
ncbi:MAG TPA: hypothetical protein VIV40_29310 [Kofleriaceae bacterium]